MTGESLFDLLGRLPDDLIDEAAQAHPPRKSHPILKWTALAACAAFAIYLGALALPPRGNSKTDSVLAASPAESAERPTQGNSDGSFLHTESPLLPLCIDAQDYTAARNTAFTLSDDGSFLFVSDEYAIQNTTDQEAKFPVTYSFVTSLNNLDRDLPTLSVDAKPVTSALQIGSLVPAQGATPPDYATLMATPIAPLESAALAQTVTVYTFADVTGYGAYDAGTLAVSYTTTPADSVLTYAINGYGADDATGQTQHSYFLNEGNSPHIAFLSSPPAELTVTGYVDGACEKIAPEITARIKKTTMSLSDFLQDCLRAYADKKPFSVALSESDSLAVVARALLPARAPSPTPQRLDELFDDAFAQDRLIRVQTDITLPANAIATVTAAATKQASFDYPGVGRDATLRGYTLTNVPAALRVTTQTATLTLPANWHLFDQNFGFLADNATTTLDPAQAHYYFTVQPK